MNGRYIIKCFHRNVRTGQSQTVWALNANSAKAVEATRISGRSSNLTRICLQFLETFRTLFHDFFYKGGRGHGHVQVQPVKVMALVGSALSDNSVIIFNKIYLQQSSPWRLHFPAHNAISQLSSFVLYYSLCLSQIKNY